MPVITPARRGPIRLAKQNGPFFNLIPKKIKKLRFVSTQEMLTLMWRPQVVEKSYLYPPDAVAAMNSVELRTCFNFNEDDLIFGFSPQSLRAACDADPVTLRLLTTKLGTRVRNEIDDDTVKFDRPGYLVPLTDREFVKKLSGIAKGCADGVRVPTDADESGYAVYHAECERHRVPGNQPVEHIQAEAVEGVEMPAASAESDAPIAGAPRDNDALSAKDPLFLKAKMYDGQLNVSLLLCGSMLLSGGRHIRGDYSAKSPLLVTRISGIRTGTTTVKYQGEELRTPDLETWVNAVRLGSKLPLGTPVHLKEGQMLTAMRRTDGKKNYVALRDQINRLQNAKLIIETTHEGLIGSIADALPEDAEAQNARATGKLKITVSLLGDSSSSTSGETEKGSHSVHIPPNVRALFGKGLSSWFREDAYYGLKNSTARRLYLLYGRHVNPRPFTLPELREYLGMGFERDDKLSKAIEKAHAEMFAKGYLVGAAAPEYSTHYPKTPDGRGGGLKRGGQKAYAIALVKDWAPSRDLVEA
jgi:hypothetical protein